jgi:hypothetical protein
MPFAIKSPVWIVILSVTLTLNVRGQISPGDLSDPHSHLTGLSKCTQCHVMGNKVQDDKCLTCHTEINSRITIQKGYHASADVKGKKCIECHSEHNGKNFQLIRLDLKTFDHDLTGYPLSVPHAEQECLECHSAKNITDPKLRAKKSTYLGVNTECLTCHDDYHLRTLSSICTNCHNQNSFVPATEFSHDKAKFRLAGRHKSVDCIKCHKVQMTEGKKFQQFRGVQYSNCTSCHRDPHENQFGQNCRQCHSEESFTVVKGITGFDHNKTSFPLEGKHLIVNCKLCHKNKLTDPLRHDHCTDCHEDYHNGQFLKDGLSPDCTECHSVNGFTAFSFSIEKHSTTTFPLKGAHVATPCFECHKKKEKWSFREIGINCKDCHTDIHQQFIQAKYYPDGDCRACHSEARWAEASYDHSKTNFTLTGTHITQPCRACHFKENSAGIAVQKFMGLPRNCSTCHTDNHFNQFAKNGETDCTECHYTETWKPVGFDHNKTAFKLDGGHEKVTCKECHKSEKAENRTFVLYKIKDFKCESCHF